MVARAGGGLSLQSEDIKVILSTRYISRELGTSTSHLFASPAGDYTDYAPESTYESPCTPEYPAYRCQQAVVKPHLYFLIILADC